MEIGNAAKRFPASGIRRMFEKASLYDDAINMSIGEPGFITPEHIIKVGAGKLLEGRTKYTPNAGIKPLRDAIAAKLRRENGIDSDPDKNLIVTAGATQALMLVMITLVNHGDEVIVPNPTWPDHVGQVVMAGATPVYAMLDERRGFKMTADILEPLITPKTKLVVVNSPANPTGAILSREELKEIADLVRRKRIYVISDEPYERLIYDDHEHVSMGSFPGMDEFLVTVNSLSKSYAMTGWRVGYACANEEITANLIKLHENMIASVNEAMQWGAIEALESGEEDIERMRRYYLGNRDIVVDTLNRIRGFSCRRPEGAFYAFPNVKELGKSSLDIADMILDKTHVVTAPGTAFGDGGEGYLRLSYANSREAVQQGLERLVDAFGLK